jgi:RNA chaperone Hfq
MKETNITRGPTVNFTKSEYESMTKNKKNQQKMDVLNENELDFHQRQSFSVSDDSINTMPNNNVSKIKMNSMQDSFLNNCRHDRAVIDISLVDKTNETGIIVGFDVNTIIMENEQKYQFLIMKSAIIKIKPIKFVNYIFNDHYKNQNGLFDYSGIKNVGG